MVGEVVVAAAGEQAPMDAHTSVGFRLLLTKASIIAGRLSSNMALHCSSISGEPSRDPISQQSSSNIARIWSTVVSSVMNSSMSVKTSMQILQVSSFLFLGRARAVARRAERMRAAFMVAVEELWGC